MHRAVADAAPGMPQPDRASERRSERLVLAAFGTSAVAGLGLLGVYLLGGQTQVEGLLLTACLGGLGLGIVIWGQRLVDASVETEPRHQLGTGSGSVEALEENLTEEAGITRRRLLLGGLGGAVAALAAALTIPVLSLGPAPGRSLFETSWRAGRRLANRNSEPVRAGDVPEGGVLTVFPDGDPTDPNAAALLIRGGPEASDPGAFVAFSKICTHAGCPVGLYRASQHTLICPCHQSEFDVLAGARPINGPAVRPLPRLPIRLEPDGTFTCLGDFPEPVGPSFWDMHR
jgi:ubiquinol-cytochrome c reductase iron-sulfur subunit